jgi:endonuclease YncB( thermonuclease family)
MRLSVLLSMVVMLSANSSLAAEVRGVAQIVDGDSLQVGTTRIQLSGIDAPEPDQICLDSKAEIWTCGMSARDELVRHVGHAVWVCEGTAKDRFGRLLAKCEVNGEDIQEWMVRSGWAMALTRYSSAYQTDEAEAREAKAGMWAGAFVAPWDWRNRNKNTVILGAADVPAGAREKMLSRVSSAGAPAPGCNIKGNVNRSGVCIYHPPGSRWYAKVNMELSGKRWFCSIKEAEAAGCRLTRR